MVARAGSEPMLAYDEDVQPLLVPYRIERDVLEGIMRFANQSNVFYESAMVKRHWISNLPKELLEAEGYHNEQYLVQEDVSSSVSLRQRLNHLDSLREEASVAGWRLKAETLWDKFVVLMSTVRLGLQF